MLKTLILIGLISMTLCAECKSTWKADQNGCLSYYYCDSGNNEKREWYGACVDGKIEGHGVLKWYPGDLSGSSSSSNKTLKKMKGNLSQSGYYIGYADQGVFSKGLVVLMDPEVDYYFISMHKDDSYMEAVVFHDSLNSMEVGKFLKDSYLIDGEGFIAYFQHNVYELGKFQEGQRKNTLVSFFQDAKEKDFCDITTALRNELSTQYQNHYKGACSIRSDLGDEEIFIEKENVWIYEGNSLLLTLKNRVIRMGQFKDFKLQGKGYMVTDGKILSGSFQNDKLVKGWRINDVTDVKDAKVEKE